MIPFYKTIETQKINNRLYKVLFEPQSKMYMLVSLGEIMYMDKSRECIDHQMNVIRGGFNIFSFLHAKITA